MNFVKELCEGRFSTQMLYRYLIFVCSIYWGLIFLAWLGYPTENRYSILTHTFSFLGSYDPNHSPQWWWLFSGAMIFWSVTSIPLAIHIYRYFSRVSKWGARVGEVLLLTGCINVGLIGIFPDVKTPVASNIRVTDIHEKVAILAASGFVLGILMHGSLLLWDRFCAHKSQFKHKLFIVPYSFWLAVVSIAAFFLIRWEYIYAAKKAAALASGRPIGSSWSEALNTIYSFPLWENIVIYSLFIFIIWFSALLPKSSIYREHCVD